jgi:hypothetical protein
MGKSLDPKVAEKVMLKQGWKPLEPYKSALAKWRCKCIKCNLNKWYLIEFHHLDPSKKYKSVKLYRN